MPDSPRLLTPDDLLTYVGWQLKSGLVPLEALKAAIQNHFVRRSTEDDRLNRKAIESRLAQAIAQIGSLS